MDQNKNVTNATTNFVLAQMGSMIIKEALFYESGNIQKITLTTADTPLTEFPKDDQQTTNSNLHANYGQDLQNNNEHETEYADYDEVSHDDPSKALCIDERTDENSLDAQEKIDELSELLLEAKRKFDESEDMKDSILANFRVVQDDFNCVKAHRIQLETMNEDLSESIEILKHEHETLLENHEDQLATHAAQSALLIDQLRASEAASRLSVESRSRPVPTASGHDRSRPVPTGT